MKKFKRIVASILVLCMMVGLVPANAMPVEAAGETKVVIAASDYQRSDSGTIMQSIMNQIKEDYGTAYGALLGGDYDAGSVNTKASHIVAVDEVIDSVFSDIADENRIYIQGNHENYAGLKVDGTNLMKDTGKHDTEYYGVYAINHDDFPWSTSTNPSSSSTLVQATANELGDYLEDKIASKYKKPIFVMSHLPLHATSRGDNKYAKLIFDELEAAGEAGLNIIFLCGHNHSGGYDAYLGNGSFYLPKGSSLTVVDGSSNKHTDENINFTYMNYGYLGNITGSACTHQTMTAFEITDNKVVVKRYDTDGLHELKAAGANVSGYNTDSNVYGTAVIDLSTGESTISDLGNGDDSGNTDDGNTGSGTGNYTYELVTEIKAGEKYVIVGNDDPVALMDNNGSFGNQTVAISGNTLTSDTALTEWTISNTSGGTITSDKGNGLSYSSSSWNLTGKADNTFNIATGKADNFTILTVRTNSGYSKYYFNYDGSGWTSKATSAAYVRLYKLTSEGSATGGGSTGGGTVTPEGGDWVEISSGVGGTIYTLTDTLEAGKEYLVVNANSGSGYALTNPGVSSGSVDMDATAVDIQSGTTAYIKTDATDVVWTATQSGTVIKLINENNYLEGKSGEVKIYSASQYSDRGWEYESNQLKYTGGSNTYTVYYDGGFTYTYRSTSNKVYLFEKTGTESAGDAEYAKLDGGLEYSVSRGATAEEALATVMAGINVQTSANADGSNPTTLDDSNTDITWTLASNYDGTVAGEYAVTISYKGVKLGTVKVIVPEVTINGISVNPASGVVNEGASDAALVGATITVDVADEEGEDYTIPVTVGMLSGNFDTKTAGTYEELTVSYNGFKYEGFTLTVKEKVVNNYPSYPNEGAVKVDKSATGIDFQKTGVAKVELSASGVPMNQGVDVMLVLDTSSSMGMQGSLDSGTRIDVLKDCVNALIKNLKEERADGSASNIDIAIVDFNGYTGNKNTNYIGSTARTTTTLGGQLTDGWVDIHTLSDTWATTNIPDDCSGTNYDHGLQQAYDMLAQKQVDDPGRKQFVLFMSDGAPFQYNGVNSNSLSSDWENWILGSYTQAEVEALSHVNNPEFYYGNNNGNGQKHRVAEAIKGAPDNKYQIVTYSDTSSSGTTKLEEVSGLGATMYSVGLALEGTNMPTDVAGQEAILKTIASSEDVFYSVTSAAGLQGAFDDFAGAVLYAADNAVFEDALGAHYNIQLANTTTRKVDGQAFAIEPAPTMEVREYTIWTRAELEDANGNLSEENAKKVGTRKTDADGNFIYNTLEKVSFNAAGTEAYTGDDTTNIMIDNVICAKTFWYNNSTASVMIDADGDATTGTDGKEFELKPETFLWKVGTIKSKEIALSYYVYLDDTLEGDASAGSYETNKYAILSYDNYLGNPCKKETVSPQMAWLSANVSYAYYLVNKDGKPVNANGEEVTFANREVVVHPTKYDEIKLNNIKDVENLTIASTGILDEGNYALFDYDAEYKLAVNSDATGGWEIKVGNDLPATTYVTDFSDNLPFTNATTSSSADDNYDYTHTTVWFAVVWEPKALDDTVVVDYGLPVDIHVMENDFFGDFGTLEGVATGMITDSDNNVTTNEVTGNNATSTFGSAEVIKPGTGANASNSVIRYTLDKDKSMQMNSKEVFTYSVDYTNTKLHTNNGYYYGQLTVIPATTIYYEDDFVTYSSYTWDYDKNDWNDGSKNLWSEVTDNTYVSDEVITQDEDRPGDINYAFDTVIDANNVYGYDSAYKECAQYSLGSAMKATVDYDNYAQAEFTFYGTGFDVVSLTSNQTGTILVYVYDEEGNKVRTHIVDTYYGYKFENKDMDGDNVISDGEGEWVISQNDPNALYQVPVVEIAGLEYGKYNVEIQAMYDPGFDHNDDETFDFYLDAIRIYDPANDGSADGTTDTTIADAYADDHEAWPVYEELRNNVIDAATYNSETGEAEIDGIVFIDSDDETASVSDYESYGPNNELYLAPGQAIAFNLDLNTYVDTVQLGMKSADGKEVSYKMFDATVVNNSDDLAAIASKKLETSTGMYYDISNLKDKTIVIYNDGSEGTLSLTDIKVTHTQNPGEVENLFVVSTASIKKIVENMNKVPEKVFAPGVITISTSPTKVYVGNKITVKVTTSDDVEGVSVDGKIISSYSVDRSGNRIWTSKISASEVGEQQVNVVAYNAEGTASNTITKVVTVSAVNSVGSAIGSVINTLFGWLFG